MRTDRSGKSKFAAMKRFFNILRKLFRARGCRLLMDGTHSCVYVPKRTYRKLMGMLYRSLEEDPKAENSLRFLWTKCGGRWLLIVNPDKGAVPMACTHGLTRDDKGRIIIPCPYMQQILQSYGLPPEWCGRMGIGFFGTPLYLGAAGQMILTRPEK